MSAVESLRTATDALSRNPVLFLAGLVYGLVVLPQRAFQLASVPLAPVALQLVTFFVTPLVVAGVVGMAREALDGDTSVDTLTAVGRNRYVDLLLGTVIELGIQLAFGVAFVVLALFALVAGGASPGPVTLVGAVLGVVVAVAYVVVLFLIQFYPVVVVVDDAGPVDAVTGSVDFVRSNVVSTLGYSVVTLVLGGLASLPVTGFVAYRFLTSDPGAGSTPGPIGGGMSPGGPGSGTGTPGMAEMFAGGSGLGLSTPEVAALSVVSLATTALFFAFRHTYATAFYRRNGRTVEERVLGDDL